MPDPPPRQSSAPVSGKVFLLEDNPRERELVFSFPVHDELNEAVKALPGRWFDWRRKNWRVPADPRLAKPVESVLARFPELEPSREVLAWLGEAHHWRAVVTATDDLGGAFLVRTLSGDPPEELSSAATRLDEYRLLLRFTRDAAELLTELERVQLDDLARACVNDLLLGRDPVPAELTVGFGDDGEPTLMVSTRWNPGPTGAFRALPEAHLVYREGRIFNRAAVSGVAIPADPALTEHVRDFIAAHPDVEVEEPARELIEELAAEHARASETVALSYADNAPLPESLELGGELHPFQRAGVQYALERRRTFIADEQGLGKTVQALATLEADDAFPAIVLCPASMKLMWEREAGIWLPHRSVAVLSGRAEESWTDAAGDAEIVVLNYDILEAHVDALVELGPKALVLDESHYVKNPQAGRTKAALELAAALPENALRLALTGTPILNRPEELITQLRVLGRLGEFGSGARLARRFKSAASNDRLHWNLRSRGYVRRTKEQVLPQLPAKRHDTVPLILANEQEYRLAERDVVAWLQTLPLDLRELDAKVAAALRSEQLVRLNHLRQLAAAGKLPTALAWIDDFLASGEPLVVFAEHIAIQQALLERFQAAAHILGSDSASARQAAVDAFQADDGPQLIVCSLRAASQGITLTRASNVAFMELDWTPARHDQAEDRLHRIGQRDAVTAWYLLAPNTIDETMAGVLERKRGVIAAVTDGEVRDEERLVEAVVRELRDRPLSREAPTGQRSDPHREVPRRQRSRQRGAHRTRRR